MRHPKPRYTHTWDVHLLTKYLAHLGSAKLLTLKLLSIKLAMLFVPGVSFTLTTARRGGSLDQLPQAFFASCPHNKRLSLVDTLRLILKILEKYAPYFHRPSQTLCSFLMSSLINRSHQPLLAAGSAHS